MRVTPSDAVVFVTLEVGGSVYRARLKNVTINYDTQEITDICHNMFLVSPGKMTAMTIKGDLLED